ncbi:TRAP transporter substrate-binding protein [Desulfonema magnum]|uniref:C4-TRAP dicarboxylate transporter, periplasmatic binding protein n=1 Tax=Desulfonema magnum TaxID=45655 RepID=A0A975BIR6_9BACT|nr:TRAP transporter substrate-binding protein [Desulfonema magnum]QTA85840.1 C4-TRAP dicarboxylate transporter, periplasmatic binding protein [Desulfonema magnum]
MKIIFYFFAGVLLMPCLTATGGEAIVLNISHDLPEDSPQHLGMIKFGEIVSRESSGDIKVKIYPKGKIGTDQKTVELLRRGIIQASLVPTAKLSRFDKSLQIADLPFLFPSKEICYFVLDSEVGEKILAGLEEIGLKGLVFWESGFKQLTADRPIRKPEDYKGLKIRVMDSPILMEQFEIMGAKARPMDFSEVYKALKLKIFNGQENPLVSITKMKFYEVQSHMTLSYHGYLGYAFLLGKSFWDSLDTVQQNIIKQAALKAGHYEREVTASTENDCIKIIADSGTEIIRLTAEERKAFENATKPIHEKFADTVGRQLLEAVYAKIKACQK